VSAFLAASIVPAVVGPSPFHSPSIAYSALSPILITAVAALVGVLVEAFAPRAFRWVTQVAVALLGLAGALIAVAVLAGTHTITADTAVSVDGPTLFLQGTIALLGIGSILLVADRSPEMDGGAFVAQAATAPGSSEERLETTAGRMQTEVFPLMMFAVTGMLLFPASNDLLLLFVALEVLSLPLYLLCGLARRRRLLSQEAAVKYFLLGAFSSAFFLYGLALLYGYAGTVSLGGIQAATLAGTHDDTLLFMGLGLLGVGLLFKIGAAPFHSWIPDVYHGAPTPITAFMASGRLGDRDPHDGGRLGVRDHPDRCEADAGLLLGRARRLYPGRSHRAEPRRAVRVDVLPADLWHHDDRVVRRPHAGPRP
jgi:NADH-quinone oxidoreductase subunit N